MLLSGLPGLARGAAAGAAPLSSPSARRALSASVRALSTKVPYSKNAEAMEQKYLLGNYATAGVRSAEGLVFVKGSKCKLYDSKGREYVDWAAGIAVNALGHSDPSLAEAVSEQMRRLQHVSNYFHTWEPLELAAAMVESSAFFDKVFFCNSGTEANEAALKFARKHALVEAQRRVAAGCGARGPPPEEGPPPAAFASFACKGAAPSACFTRGGVCGCWPQAADNDLSAVLRTEVIAFTQGFHGRSMGSLAATHKPAIRQPFSPMPGDVKFARFNNLADVDAVISHKTVAVIVEPVQGEGGVIPAEAAFMNGLREMCDAHGVLLIVDEVQCGLGRTGRLWAHEAFPECRPDMMTLAKPLAGGLPIGAVMMSDAVASAIVPGDHGTTFGGNTLVVRAAQVVFSRVSEHGFLAASRERGAQLIAGLRALQAAHPRLITAVRTCADSGLFVGVELAAPPKKVVRAALDAGLVLITGGDSALRICPPLVISAEEIEFGLAVLAKLLPQVYPEMCGVAPAGANAGAPNKS